jgi:hypothetical protein
LPCPASGEDRALADALLRYDIPIRTTPKSLSSHLHA